MASKKQYTLSEEDVKFLRDLAHLDNANPGGRALAIPGIINHAPEVFIANVSSTIPARSSNVPGVASCSIYMAQWKSSAGTSQDVELIDLSGVAENVYNLSTTAVSAGYYVVRREKFGHLVLGRFPCTSGTGTGTVNPPTTCCPGGSPLVGYSVVISGMSGTSCAFNSIYGFGCTINCADLNGTYVMLNGTNIDCTWGFSKKITWTNCGGPAFPRTILIQLDIQANGSNRDVTVTIAAESLAATFFYARHNNVTTACAALAETLVSGVECCNGGTAVVTALN